MLAACQPFTTYDSIVADRFRAEYDCEPTVNEIGGTSYEAKGCGHRATYT